MVSTSLTFWSAKGCDWHVKRRRRRKSISGPGGVQRREQDLGRPGTALSYKHPANHRGSACFPQGPVSRHSAKPLARGAELQCCRYCLVSICPDHWGSVFLCGLFIVFQLQFLQKLAFSWLLFSSQLSEHSLLFSSSTPMTAWSAWPATHMLMTAEFENRLCHIRVQTLNPSAPSLIPALTTPILYHAQSLLRA